MPLYTAIEETFFQFEEEIGTIGDAKLNYLHRKHRNVEEDDLLIPEQYNETNNDPDYDRNSSIFH